MEWRLHDLVACGMVDFTTDAVAAPVFDRFAFLLDQTQQERKETKGSADCRVDRGKEERVGTWNFLLNTENFLDQFNLRNFFFSLFLHVPSTTFSPQGLWVHSYSLESSAPQATALGRTGSPRYSAGRVARGGAAVA